ncbi:MAG: WYL domain-containing protein [Muribaculaceae bacterium]|nr:WYL domain-containing protein [Muribaculaceae bacterium]
MQQNLVGKYVWLIETIYRAKRITFKEINERWRDNVDMSGGEDLPLRTFNNWRYAIQDMFGLFIENERCGGYRYYIENEEDINDNGLRSWIYSTYCVSNALAGCQSIKSRILLEDVPSGQIFLHAIIDAMKENRTLNITYKSYLGNEEKSYTSVHPLCIKLFRQRWYVVVRYDKPGYSPWICALDRILSLEKTEETFTMPKDWDAEEFFDGFIGVLRSDDYDKEMVKIKISEDQANYLRSLKIHESQEEVERNEDFSIFTYFLRPTYDFQQELLKHGESLEVLGPQWLRDEMRGRIEKMFKLYNSSPEVASTSELEG